MIIESFTKPKAIALATMTAIGSLASTSVSAQALEEVLVTAQKRTVNLQDTPVAVSAFSGDQIQAFNMQSSQDIAAKTPNLYMAPSGGGLPLSQQVYIRGQGQNAINITNDPSIGTYIDDIYVSKDSGSLIELVDIERIEVLRGPQGTLYGRNTTGGAIKIFSVRPDPAAGYTGWVTANGGNYGKARVQGAINLPLSDTFALRYAGSYHERDGYTDTFYLDALGQPVRKENTNDLESQFHRLNAQWNATDDLSFFASGYYVDAKINGHLSRNLAGDIVGAAGFGFFSNDFYEGAASDTVATGDKVAAKSEVDGYGLSLDATWNTPAGFEAKGIISYRKNDTTADDFDVDGTAWPFLNVHSAVPQDFESFSAEIQLSGLALDDRLSWLTGLYYFEEEGSDASNSKFFTGAPPAIAQVASGFGENESIAVFAHLTYDLTEKLTVEGGLRWTEDTKGLDGENRIQPQGFPELCFYIPGTPDVTNTTGAVGGPIGPGDICQYTPSESWSYWSWNVGAQYQFTDDVMTYIKSNSAQRAGGHQFRDASGEFAPFDEETLTDVEIGIKSEFADNRVRLNAAYFFGEYEDYQFTIQPMTSIGTTTTATVNFGDADVSGFELDLTVLIVENLTFMAGYGRVEIDYDEKDYQQLNVPETTGFMSLSYQPVFSFGQGLAQVNWSYRDEVEKEVSKSVDLAGSTLDDYDLVDARIGVTLNSGLEIFAWGRNLAEEEYYSDALNFGSNFIVGYVGEPRTYGLEIGYRW